MENPAENPSPSAPQSLQQRAFRIGISGSYGGLNLGDEAILHSIVAQLRRSLPVEITVFSRNPGDTLRRHKVDRAVPIRDMARDEARAEVERLDLLLIGGGGILFDGEAALFLREGALAQDLGVPVMFYAISAGPLKERQSQQMVRDVLNRARVVTVREREARKLLEEVGVVREIQVTADPALLLEPEPLCSDDLTREGLDSSRRLVGFSVREPGPAAPDLDTDHYHALLANTADFIADRYEADIIFVPMEQQDLQHSHAVIAQMSNPRHARVLRGQYSSGQILGLIGRLEFAVGMRLHFLIFAALQGVPFVALPYAGKVRGFLDDLGVAAPPVQHVDAGRLAAHIDRSWDCRKQIREHVQHGLPALQERARQTHRIALEILTKSPVPS